VTSIYPAPVHFTSFVQPTFMLKLDFYVLMLHYATIIVQHK